MNDPSDMVYDSTDGYWYLFYQYSPSNSFYKQSQVHIRSRDLVHWEQQPLGLQIDEHGLVFSGSVIEDNENTSGLFNDKPEESKLVSIYTYHDEKTGEQSQGIASSKDHGATWQKYAGNPVIPNEGNTLSGDNFRDPRVFKIDGDAKDRWYMVITEGAAQTHVSGDLIYWEKSQPLKYKGGEQILSECPGLIPAKVNGAGETKWIYNESAGFYMVGSIKPDGNGIYRWTAESNKIDIDSNANPWDGFGKYATMAFYWDGTGKNRQIGISWLQDFIEFDGKTYKELQSLPQEYGLEQDADGNYIVISDIVEEMDKLGDTKHILYQTEDKKISSSDANILRDVSGIRYDLKEKFTLGAAKGFGFKLRRGNGKELVFKYNRETQNMYVDGRNAGYHVSSNSFSYTLEPLDRNEVKLRVIIDQGAVEAFGNDGEASISTAIYQENSGIGMELFCDDGGVTIDQLKICGMKSMYTGKSGSESEAPQLYLSAPREAQVHTEFRVDTNMYPNMGSGDVVQALDPGLQLVKEEKGSVVVSGSKKGAHKIKASAQGLEREVEIKLFTSSFASNTPDWSLDGGIWAKTADGVVGSNTSGDSFLIHDTQICRDKPFIYEAGMHILEGTAAGIVFGVSDRNNPSAGWFCTNVERKDNGSSITKLFKSQNGEVWDITKVTPAKKIKAATQAYLKVVYGDTDKLKYWLDGEEILERSDVDMQNGYLGVQTFRPTTVFNNVSIQYLGASVISLMEKIPALTIAFGDKTLRDQLPRQILVKLDNDVELPGAITWSLEDVDVNKAGVYTLCGKAAGHTIEVKVAVRVDKKELQKSLDQAKTYVEKDYARDSWKAFEAARYRITAAYADETAMQDDVSSCAAVLEKVMQGLEKAVVAADKRDLKGLVASTKRIKAEGYAANSYAALEKAITAAEKVLANEKALQSEMDTALKNLKQAILALGIGQGTANRGQLQNLVSILKTARKEGYTAASWETFIKTLRQAGAVLTNGSADEAAIAKAYEALQQSYRKLQPVSTGGDEKPQGDGQKEPSKSDAEHPDIGDATSAGAAGMLTLLAGGAAVVLRRRRKQGKSKD